MTQLFVNNATSTLNGSITNVQTTIAVQAIDAAKFPSPTGGNFFLVTVVDGSGNIEIMKCTARASATLTVVRAQESTTGFAFASGARVDARLTAGAIANFLQFTGPNIINDDQLVVADPVDTTKRGRLDAGLVTSGQTRIWSGPDSDGNLIINLGSFQLKQSAGPTPTAEGDIQWHTTENAIYIGDGATTKVFRANDWEKIAFAPFAAVASAPLIGLSTTYRDLRLTYSIDVSVDGTGLGFQVSTDNGVSYLLGATEYNNFSATNNGATIGLATTSTTTVQLDNNAGVDNSSIGGIRGVLQLFDFNQATVFRWINKAWLRVGAGSGREISSSGDGTSAVAKNALRFIPNSGTITGRVLVEGMR
jgi:hypothetical protein